MALINDKWEKINSEFAAKSEELLKKLNEIKIEEGSKGELADIIEEYNNLQADYADSLSVGRDKKGQIESEIEEQLELINTALGNTDASLNKSNAKNVQDAINSLNASNLPNKTDLLDRLNELQASYDANIIEGNEFTARYDEIKGDIKAASISVLNAKNAAEAKISEFEANGIDVGTTKITEMDDKLKDSIDKNSKLDVEPEVKPEEKDETVPESNTINDNLNDMQKWDNKYTLVEKRLENAEKGLDNLFKNYGIDLNTDSYDEKFDMVMVNLTTDEAKAKFKKEFAQAMKNAEISKKNLVQDFNTITRNAELILERIKAEIAEMEAQLINEKAELENEKEELTELEAEKEKLQNELEAIDKEIETLEAEIEEDKKAGNVDQSKLDKLEELKGRKTEIENNIKDNSEKIEEKTKKIDDKTKLIEEKTKKIEKVKEELDEKEKKFNEKRDKTRALLESKGLDIDAVEEPEVSPTNKPSEKPVQTQGTSTQTVPAPATSDLTLAQQNAQPAKKQAGRNRTNYQYVTGYLSEGERMTKTEAMNRFKAEVGGKEFAKLHRALQELNASIIEPTRDEKKFLANYMTEERNYLNIMTDDSDYKNKFKELAELVGVTFESEGRLQAFCDKSFADTEKDCGVLAGFTDMKEPSLKKWNDIINAYGAKKGEMTEEQIEEFEKYIMSPVKFGLLHDESKKYTRNTIVKTISRVRELYGKKDAITDPDSKAGMKRQKKNLLETMKKSIIKIECPETQPRGFNDSLRDDVYPPRDTPPIDRTRQGRQPTGPQGRE